MNLYRLLADAIVVFHFAYVAFVVLGMLVILVGLALRWRFVRNFWFRTVHFLMIALVAAEAMGGVFCPLTTWEAKLREAAGESVESGTFIGRWVHRLMFFEAPERVFTICYCGFCLLVLLTLLLAPPRWPWRKK
jgi:glucan phosphoethanolaminetransferase (alkaline phosphatase superfamily)